MAYEPVKLPWWEYVLAFVIILPVLPFLVVGFALYLVVSVLFWAFTVWIEKIVARKVVHR